MAIERSLWEKVQTAVLVTLVSVLVWIFAEGESLATNVRNSVRLQIANDPDLWTRISLPSGDPWSDLNSVSIEGAAGAVSQVMNELAGGIRLVAGRDIPADPGEFEIELREVLSKYPPIQQRGVTVTEVDPPKIIVTVDTLREIEARVVPRKPQDDPTLTVEAVPPTVMVTLPSRQVPASERIDVFAPLSAEDLAGLTLGTTPITIDGIKVNFEDRLANVPGARIEPAEVDLRVVRRVRTGTKTLPTVPVHIRVPAVSIGLYEIHTAGNSETLADVVLEGPADLLDQIGPGKRHNPVAVVELLPDEIEAQLARGVETATIEKAASLINLPSGVEFKGSNNPIVSLVIRRRNADGGAGPGE